MHGRGEIIRPVSGKGKGGLPRTASAGRIGAGNTLPRLRSGERKEGRRGGRDRREKRRRVNSLFLEAPLKRPPKLPLFSSPVPALTSLSLSLFFTCPSIVISLLLGTVLYYLASFALFSLSLSPSLSIYPTHDIGFSLSLPFFAFLFLRRKVYGREKKVRSNNNGRMELILRARKAKGVLSSFLHGDFDDYCFDDILCDCQISV